MFPISHILVPVVAVLLYGRLSRKVITDRQVLFAGVAGVLPDLLNVHIALAERASVSHSLLVLIPLALVVVLTSDRLRTYSNILFAAVAIHLVLDIVSNPYNFLYPLQFDPTYPVLSQCGLGTFFCWYLVDLCAVLAFVALTYWPTIRELIPRRSVANR